MKKVLLSLLAVAALVLSCQNYDDEFDALNSKIASLESQISSLDDLRTAVTGVQSSISALQSAVAAAQAAAEAADSSDAITALATSVAAISADLVELQTAIAGATTEADLTALRTQLESTLEALRVLIQANSDQITSLVATNADLKSELEALGVDVDAVLAQNSTYTGNINITNAAELAFAKSLGDKVKVINGNVKITIGYTNDLTAADVAPVTKLIEQVVGNVTLSMDHEPIDLSALVNVSGDYLVEGWDPTDDNLANVGDMYLEYRFPYSYPNLLTAKKIILNDLAKSDGTTKSTTTVTEPIGAQPGVTSVNFLALTSATSISSGSADPHTSGASTHSSGGNINLTAGGTAGTLSLLNATSVIIGDVAVSSLTTKVATTVELHFDGTASAISITDSATTEVLSSVIIKAKKVSGNVAINMLKTGSFNAPQLAEVNGTLSSDAATHDLGVLAEVDGLTLSEATSVSLPKLAVVGEIGTSSTSRAAFSAPKLTGTVSLPALTKASALDFDSASAIDAKLADVTSIDLDETEELSIDLASITTSSGFTAVDLAKIKTLNLHAQDSDVASADLADLAVATSVTILGKKNSVDVSIAGTSTDYEKLLSLTLGGKLGIVDVEDLAVATTIVTSGTISDLTIDNNDKLTTLTLGHTEDPELGAVLTIMENALLTTFATSVNRVTSFVVINNVKLGSFDASSITTLPTNASGKNFTFTVTGNSVQSSSATTNALSTFSGIKGTYTPLNATTERAYGQASIATLKPYLQAIFDKVYPADGGASALGTVDIDLHYLIDNTPSASGSAAAVTTIKLANDTTASGDFQVDVDGSSNDVSISSAKAGFQEILKIQ